MLHNDALSRGYYQPQHVSTNIAGYVTRINIERGRWNGTPRNERICRFCNKVEDEYHFLFECTIYSTIRETYLSRYYRVRPNMYKTVELLSSDKVKLLRNLAVYVYKAFELRQCINNM